MDAALAGIEEGRREGVDRVVDAMACSDRGRNGVLVRLDRYGSSEPVVPIASDPGITSNQSVMRIRARTHLEAAAGSPSAADRATAEVDRVIADAVQNEQRFLPDQIADVRIAAAFAAVWHGRPDQAIDHVRRGLEALAGCDGSIAAAWLLLAGMRAIADATVRDRARGRSRDVSAGVEQAQAWYDAAVSLADGSFAPGAGRGPFPAMVLRLIEPERDRAFAKDDPDAWRATAAAAATFGLPLFVADANRRAAVCYLAAGDRPAAAAALREAASTARRIEATTLLGEITALGRSVRIDLEAVDPGDQTDPSALTPSSAALDPWGLSEREREVLALLADGRTNRQIGDALFISDKTASVHVTHILSKLGVSSRTEAALMAARAGTIADVRARTARLGPVERTEQVGDEVVDAFDPDRQADERRIHRERRLGHGHVGHRGRDLDERLHAAERLGEGEPVGALGDRDRALRRGPPAARPPA